MFECGVASGISRIGCGSNWPTADYWPVLHTGEDDAESDADADVGADADGMRNVTMPEHADSEFSSLSQLSQSRLPEGTRLYQQGEWVSVASLPSASDQEVADPLIGGFGY